MGRHMQHEYRQWLDRCRQRVAPGRIVRPNLRDPRGLRVPRRGGDCGHAMTMVRPQLHGKFEMREVKDGEGAENGAARRFGHDEQ